MKTLKFQVFLNYLLPQGNPGKQNISITKIDSFEKESALIGLPYYYSIEDYWSEISHYGNIRAKISVSTI